MTFFANTDDFKMMKCKNCKLRTSHIKRGFGKPGSLCGNARWCCLECEHSQQRKDKRGKVHFLDTDKRYACNKAVFSNGLITRSWKLVTCKNCLRREK